jgi:hypothetical protein
VFIKLGLKHASKDEIELAIFEVLGGVPARGSGLRSPARSTQLQAPARGIAPRSLCRL